MNSGDTAFMLISTAFVFFMTPGLAFFYGGLVRRKNVCNTMMACVSIMGLSVVMWALFGYSLAFGGNHGGIIGDLRWIGLSNVGMKPGPYADTIPHLVFCAFQMMFAMITPALITGSLVGRMKFKALFLFVAIWSVIVYYPMAHMVWGEGGLLAAIGSVDFAGGDVVHISSGVSALVLAIIQEKIDEILEQINLKDEKEILPNYLSHGQRQWLEIGMVLAQNPEIITLDEPTAGMTADETYKTGELILNVMKDKTLIVVEHDIDFVKQISEKITVLSQGEILAEGSYDDITSNPEVVRVYLKTD